jgi:tetratricopeptide (TPR) repeat protein
MDLALRGWQCLQEQDFDDAMPRFNQAWLLIKSSGTALWGMAAIEASAGKPHESLKVFAEAERPLGQYLNFSVDYANAMGKAGAASRDQALLQDAFHRFERIYQRAPQNTLNLENWALTLLYAGKYAGAWERSDSLRRTWATSIPAS